ncbi:AI-2E family transporter [Pseudomonadota bacterium]
MITNDLVNRRNEWNGTAAELLIRLAVLAVLLIWCFRILEPFIMPVIWGIIIAVAIHPLYERLTDALGGRRRLAAAAVSTGFFLLLLVPTAMLGRLLVRNVATFAGSFDHGQLRIPLPPEGVREWPLIGESIANLWKMTATNLGDALKLIEPQIKALGGWLVDVAASAGLGLLMLLFAFVIAGVMLATSARGDRLARDISQRLAGPRGDEFATLVEVTIRSVARSVLGVAVIQTMLASFGMMAAGVPGVGIWALLCLVLSTVQIGVGPVLVPAVIWVFATGDTLTGLLFLVWSVFVMLSDNLLKPLLLGRGADVPMAVIFLGSIGGMLSSGIVGLFIGAIVLSLGYKLFQAWLTDVPQPQAGPGSTTGSG